MMTTMIEKHVVQIIESERGWGTKVEDTRYFDTAKDAWFDLDLEHQRVLLRKRDYIRQGEVGNWLVSDAFDLKEPRSLEGEQAIATAQALMQAAKPTAVAIKKADTALRSAGLPDIDPFWVRWRAFGEKHLPRSTT